MSIVQLGRMAWWVLVAMLLPAAAVLWLVSAEAASQFPEFAHLRLPIYVAVVAGAVPILLAAPVVEELLVRVGRGEMATARTAHLFRRLAVLSAAFAVYTALVFVGMTVALGQGHPGLLLAWVGVETVSVFVFSVAWLLGRATEPIPAEDDPPRVLDGAR